MELQLGSYPFVPNRSSLDIVGQYANFRVTLCVDRNPTKAISDEANDLLRLFEEFINSLGEDS